MEKYDVAVIGGGTAGVVAAVQAAREGASVLLVEKSELLGGTITNAGVSSAGLFFAWKKQIIAGIGWEIISKCVDEGHSALPDFSKQEQQNHSREHVRFNRSLFAMLCDEAVVNAGVHVSFDTMLAEIVEGESEKILTLCTKEGLKRVSTTVLIDCTRDANAVTLAGYPVERSEHCQPSTYYCRLSGYNKDNLDFEEIGKAYDKEVEKGNLSYISSGWDPDKFTGMWIKGYGGNGSHVSTDGIHGDTSEGRTRLCLDGRLAILNSYRFLRTQKGLESLEISDLLPECGVRETVRIIGEKTITSEDYLSGKRYGDDVCYAFYPIDLHSLKNGGLQKTYLQEGIVPTIPRGALLPKGSHNLIVAGRCISADQAANSAVRVEASCMATGQVAGALAAITARTGTEPSKIPMEDLRAVLERHGAIVP